MTLIRLMLVSAVSLVNADANWSFEHHGLTAVLADSQMAHAPLRLSCAQKGYLEIDIRADQKPDVTLVGPSNMRLTLRGELTPDGRLVSNVYFKSLTVEFLREEGEIEVLGGHDYRLNLSGARGVLDALQSSCLAVS